MRLNPYYLQIGGLVFLIFLALWWAVFQWDECRSLGFSVWYCMQHIA